MKLSIHLISHPITQKLSNLIINQESSCTRKNQALKQLGLFMTYEAIRNWLKIYKLTIKGTKDSKEIIAVDPKESYIIIFNNLKNLSFFHDVQELIPKNKLKLISESEISRKSSLIQFPDIDVHTKIIIAMHQACSEYILNLLDYLTKQKNIKLKKIRLTCITCTTSQLINISAKYTDLNIYTTKIAQN